MVKSVVLCSGRGPDPGGVGWPDVTIGPIEVYWNGVGSVSLGGNDWVEYYWSVDDYLQVYTPYGSYFSGQGLGRDCHLAIDTTPRWLAAFGLIDITHLFVPGKNTVAIHVWSDKPTYFSYNGLSLYTTGEFSIVEPPVCPINLEI